MYPYVFARDNVWQGKVTAQKGWSAFNRVGPAEAGFQDHEVLETFYSEAESFLQERTKDKPFFLFLALTAPHTPTSPGVKWKGKSKKIAVVKVTLLSHVGATAQTCKLRIV